MESKRYREPKQGEKIYHYCSAEAFYNIVNNQSIRFGDIAHMNDSFEMLWAFEFFKRILVDWGKNKNISETFFQRCILDTRRMNDISNLFCACFTSEPDQLSQWRGYADDGKGFSIGFDFTSITKSLPVKPIQVVYDNKILLEELVEMLGKLYKEETSRNFTYSKEFRKACYNIACEFAGYKYPFFHEEKEIRLVHKVNIKRNSDGDKFFTDDDSVVFGKKHTGQDIYFKMKANRPVAYIEYNFKSLGEKFPLVEILIGPKNPSSIEDISIYLSTLGLNGVKIDYSIGSYRD